MAFVSSRQSATRVRCYHCGLDCPDESVSLGDRYFCCTGCRAVCQLLTEAGLGDYYDNDSGPGVKPADDTSDRFEYLNHPAIIEQLADYTDGHLCRLRLYLPAIHCSSCVYLLENLYRLSPGVKRSSVDFLKKELSAVIDLNQTGVASLVRLLSRLGYEAEIRMKDTGGDTARQQKRRLYSELGVAGFCYANIMLFSFPEYLGFSTGSHVLLKQVFGWVSAGLSLPVLFFAARHYLRSAYAALRYRSLNIDVPIALGMVTLFIQSWFEVLAGAGAGYFDSLAGLTFFLLVGRVFQQKTYERLSFERDYRSYLPLSALRRHGDGTEVIPIGELEIGDQLLIRDNEIIPADATLMDGDAHLDYSFVTGESEPQDAARGQHLFAGGRQIGSAIEVEVRRPVSESRLVSLWSEQDERNDETTGTKRLIDRVARYFTVTVLGIALAAGLTWLRIEPSQAIRVFTSVLIVACPCALALSGPFAFGMALRLLGRAGLFLKNTEVVERLTRITTVVFDKTGTLAAAEDRDLEFVGEPLSDEERALVASLAAHSTHPMSQTIARVLDVDHRPVRDFEAVAGQGIVGMVGGHGIRLGSRQWVGIDDPDATRGTWLTIDNRPRGVFVSRDRLRPGIEKEIAHLSRGYKLAVMSGDTDRERARLSRIFGDSAPLRFELLPHDKRDEVRQLESRGERVLMVGDGLNDAGALEQASVGLAVANNLAAFTPASDGILESVKVVGISRMLDLAKTSLRVVWLCYLLSFAYNVGGLWFAVTGRLSPLVASILMPLSSITVVAVAVGLTRLLARSGKER